jgi:hypothetical protein
VVPRTRHECNTLSNLYVVQWVPMAGLGDNFTYSDYVSDDGNTYSVRTITAWASSATSAGTTGSTHARYGPESKVRHVRKFIFTDLTAPGRKAVLPVFTTAAYTAGVIGTTTFARAVRGVAAAVTFTLAGKSPEKVPGHLISSSATQYP